MDEKRAKELLATEREQTEEALGRARGDGPGSADQDEPIKEGADQDLFEDEMAAGREQDLQRRLDRIGEAEERLAAGTYGVSVRSGEPIPDGRLEAEPLAELTVEEEAVGEQRR